MTHNPGVLPPPPWVPDLGDGTYRNPVIHADYSDPDVIRVGSDFFLTASSFQCAPGLPVLHSTDLVNWTLIAHALPRLVPDAHFSQARPGQGVWAPAIRRHGGLFHIYYPDPDFGIQRVSATDPAGPWGEPVMVLPGRGLIDPCPLFASDGRVWLVHAWAKSRAGFNNRLTVVELDPTGIRAIDAGRTLIEGADVPGCHTLEGPKCLEHGGYVYVLAPAGGVKEGWQSAFRAGTLAGPWEHRILLHQGSTPVNGPHQGALVDTPAGHSWFLHFQDKGAFGRVVHLQPAAWREGWPCLGTAAAGPKESGAPWVPGEPVLRHAMPRVIVGPGDGRHSTRSSTAPASSDLFEDGTFGLQGQWQANPDPSWWRPRACRGRLSLIGVPSPAPEAGGLGLAPNLLLQKFPAPAFRVETDLALHAAAPGAHAGLMVFGLEWAWVGLEATAGGPRVVWVASSGAREEGPMLSVTPGAPAVPAAVGLSVTVDRDGTCLFSHRLGGGPDVPMGRPFAAVAGRWIGAKVGLFAACGSPGAHAGEPFGIGSFGPFLVSGTAPWDAVGLASGPGP